MPGRVLPPCKNATSRCRYPFTTLDSLSVVRPVLFGVVLRSVATEVAWPSLAARLLASLCGLIPGRRPEPKKRARVAVVLDNCDDREALATTQEENGKKLAFIYVNASRPFNALESLKFFCRYNPKPFVRFFGAKLVGINELPHPGGGYS